MEVQTSLDIPHDVPVATVQENLSIYEVHRFAHLGGMQSTLM